jgi:hypothetical protein
MMQRLRIFVGIFLSLAVLLTAHSAAAARGTQDATGQMVICTGTGPVTIYVDSEGQPTRPPHYCPDCIMHLLDAAAPVALGLPTFADVASSALRPMFAAEWHASFVSGAFARGPPVSV